MPDGLKYLTILIACLIVTLPLELVLGARVYRRPVRLFLTLLPVAALFVAWDLIGTARGHWSFSARYTMGPRLLGLPLEELLFFLVVPVCAVLTYEVLGRRRRPPAPKERPLVTARAGE